MSGFVPPPKPIEGRKLPTFGQIIQQEEQQQQSVERRKKERQEKEKRAQDAKEALLNARKKFAATLHGLPAELHELILSFLHSPGTYQDLKILARSIISLAGTSKALHALMNDPKTIITIFNALPYTANALSLYRLLMRPSSCKPFISLPVMESKEIKDWVNRAELRLKNGRELADAIDANEQARVITLLKDKDVDLNWLLEKTRNNSQYIRYEHRFTPLTHAARKANSEIIKILLSAGADTNIREAKDGATAILSAIMLGKTEIVKLLLVAGADLNLRYDLYLPSVAWPTARDFAARTENPEIIKLIDEALAQKKKLE